MQWFTLHICLTYDHCMLSTQYSTPYRLPKRCCHLSVCLPSSFLMKFNSSELRWIHALVSLMGPVYKSNTKSISHFKTKNLTRSLILVFSTHPKQLWILTILSLMSHIYKFNVQLTIHLKKINMTGSFDSGLFHTSPKII